MSDFRAYVFKKDGQALGYFLNPELEQLGDDQFLIKGQLYESDGKLLNRTQFNPQILPYQIDISAVPNRDGASRLFQSYVLRAQQPVEIVGSSSPAVVASSDA